MPQDFVASIIRRLNVRLMILGLLGFLGVFAGLALSQRYLYNAFMGPFPLSQADLLTIKDPGARAQYNVDVQGDDHADTGYSYYHTSSSGTKTTEAYYHVLLVGDSLLLVKSKHAEIADRVKGALVQIPSDIQTNVIAELEQESPELKGTFLPMMLDETRFGNEKYIGVGVAALVGLAALIGLCLAIYRMLDLQAHPVMKALERFGPLDTVVSEIDQDIGMPHEQPNKRLHFCRNWLVFTGGGFAAMPYRDIMWCYKQVTQHRTNGIRTGKTYAAYVYDRHGKLLIIPGKEPFVNQVLGDVTRFVPGVAAGYTDDLGKLWKKERPRFVAAVDERRRSGL